MVLYVLIILLLLLVGLVGVSFYFYNMAVVPAKKKFLSNNEDLPTDAIGAFNREGIQWMDQQAFETVRITSQDGLKLQGYFLQHPKGATKTAILIHGYGAKAKEMTTYGKFYYEKLGYNVLLPDNRGHGHSEGTYIGFGWFDRLDCLQWVQYVLEHLGEDTEILLHGVSMGGATVLMTSGENLPSQVKAIVSDCAYTSVIEQLTYQLKKMYGLPPFPILPSTSVVTRLRAGYSFEEASALKQVAKATVPILFIHGGKDTFVPVAMVYKLYEMCRSKKDLFIVPQAGHGTAYREDPNGYESTIEQFLTSV